jgi:hypothetical protein
MNRRGFLSRFAGGAAAVAAAPFVTTPPQDEPRQSVPEPVRVVKANGTAIFVGVAMESVSAGDLLQIQTCGRVMVNRA